MLWPAQQAEETRLCQCQLLGSSNSRPREVTNPASSPHHPICSGGVGVGFRSGRGFAIGACTSVLLRLVSLHVVLKSGVLQSLICFR